MEKYFALINNRIVEKVIVATDEFATSIQKDYDNVIDVTDITPRPSPDDSYYPDTQIFICNTANIVVLSDEVLPEYDGTGTDDGFEPFQLSKYAVSYEDGMVIIGCKKFSAPGLLNALHKGLVERQTGTVDCFMSSEEGPAHGKFGITWDDAQMLYDALIKVKF